MSTIKTKNGKVLTKNGKVSTCCCVEIGCCLYPCGSIDGLPYPEADLPDELDLIISSGWKAGTYRLVKNRFSTRWIEVYYLLEGVSWDGTYYSESGAPYMALEGGGWLAMFTNDDGYSSEFVSSCLIGPAEPGAGRDSYVEDTFPDTLTMTYSGTGVEVTRTNLCTWEGTDPCGNTWKLWYKSGSTGGGTQYKWNAKVWSTGDCDGATQLGPTCHADPQNTPVGTYDDGPITVTVSE